MSTDGGQRPNGPPSGQDQLGQDEFSPEQRFQLLVENVVDYAIYMLNPEGIVTNWNRGAQRFKGYTPSEIVGQHFSRFFTEEDRAARLPAHILETATKEGRYEAEGWRVRKDGTHFWASVVVDTIRDGSGRLLGFAKITRDISERRKQEERLHRLAHYDPLTNLPNRVTIKNHLEEALAATPSVTVLMLDLDGFKEVNDTLGHAVGDTLLKMASGRIYECVGAKGTLGRIGGDEFAVVVPRVADPTMAAKICNSLLKMFKIPFFCEEEIYLGISIGIAMSPNHGDSADELLANADIALYRAKADRSKGYKLYQSNFRQAARARRHCEQELRQAVAEGQLEVFYQPQVNLVDYRVIGAEALLRWRHPQQGLLTPASFLGVLERGPLAATVGDWMIGEALSQAAKIRNLGIPAFRMAVNLFPVQLRKGHLVSTVTDALKQNGLPPDALELEITENVILRQDDAVTSPLNKLRELGVSIVFDDYGTGYASLSLLKSFPVSGLKIDRRFVRNVCSDTADAAVVKAIAYLAESFDMEVTAEGIEDEKQRMRLRELGCEKGQGYLFARPMPGARMLQLVAGGAGDGAARWSKAPAGAQVSLQAG